MKKLAVDEIIGGLVDGYEKLLILATDPDCEPAEYHHALGEVAALRWVLGQPMCSIDGRMPDNNTDQLERDLNETDAFILCEEDE